MRAQRVDHVAQVDVLALERDAHRARARHVEQPLRDVLEALDVLVRRVDQLALLGVERRPRRGRSSSTAMRSEVSGVRSSCDSVAMSCSRRASWSRR